MTAPRFECRWCGKGPLVYWNGKWHHLTKQYQRECPNPLPFEDQLNAKRLEDSNGD